jgi:L-lactate dehydrogenase
VALIGAGRVGATFAYALMINGVAGDIVLVDAVPERAEGEAMDLSHGLPFVRPCDIRAGSYADCQGADVVVITAGAAQKPGETRLELVRRNVDILRSIVPELARYAGDAIWLAVSNPVDIMTYAALKLSGKRPQEVIGSGTVLDTARLRTALSQHCGVDPRNVHAYVIGEHGDSEVPVWSLANIAGIRFDEYCLNCGVGCSAEVKQRLFTRVRDAAYQIIERKGATYYAIGLAATAITQTILRDESSVLTVSSLLAGEPYGITDVCLSTPSVVTRAGIRAVVPLSLNEAEIAGLQHSAQVLRDVIGQIALYIPASQQ